MNRWMWPCLAGILALCFGLYCLASLIPAYNFGIDDANIYFVYAKNIAAGQGIVYNAGGEHVEGFSSVLWQAVCSAILYWEFGLEKSLLFVNVFLLSLVIVSGCYFLSQQLRSRYKFIFYCFFILLIIVNPGYLVWMGLTLMENALWSLVLLLLVLNACNDERNDWYSAVLIAAVLLARPEGLAYTAAFIGLIAIGFVLKQGLRVAVVRVLPLFVAFALTNLALLVFRYDYFGFPFPNTYYAKVDSSLLYNIRVGSSYLLNYYVSGIIPFFVVTSILIAASTLLLGRLSDWRRDISALEVLIGFSLLGLLIPVLLGGDHFAEFRFFQNFYPIFLISSLLCIDALLDELSAADKLLKNRLSVVCAVVVMAMGLMLTGFKAYKNIPQSDLIGEFLLAKEGRSRGEMLNRLFEREEALPVVGVVAAGGFKYFYEGPVFDVLGLNHVAMGHNEGDRKGIKNNAAFNKEVFYQYAPDLLTVEVKDASWVFAVDKVINKYIATALKNIFYDERFKAIYQFASIADATGTADKKLIGWVHRDMLEAFSANDNYRLEIYDFY